MRPPHLPLRQLPLALAAGLTSTAFLHAQTDVLTWHNDNLRTGANLAETLLTPATVNATSFGLLRNIAVDGKVDAQPLYVSATYVAADGHKHNVLLIVTEHDSVYAVDADNGTVYWQRSLLKTGETTSDSRNCGQVTPEIGITATPVIDRGAGPSGTAYVIAMSKDGAGNYYQRLHALDLSSGAELSNSPVDIHATYPGTGDNSANGTVTFDPKQYKERPGLLLHHGNLYTSWSSHCDIRPYTGWMMTYNPSTLAQTGVFNFVPNGSDASPWNAGAGPASDAQGNTYIALGNGTFDTTLTPQGFPNQGDFGNGLVKLAFTNGSLTATDYWTMYDTVSQSAGDVDLGSGGLMLLPDQVDAAGVTRHLAIAAGKDSNLYVADRDHLGHFNPNDNTNLYQELPGALPGGIWSSPAFFNGHLYYGSVGRNLRSFSVSAAKVVASPIQTTSTTFGYPGTTPSVSANGSAHGIVWAPENASPAVLHAYDAGNLSTELYNSNQAAANRDHFGNGNKFIAPTIANGKVFVATQNSVGVFGFLPRTPAPLADGVYILLNGASGFALDDPGASSAAGTRMYQWPSNNGLNQHWFFSYNGTGYYTIQNTASHLFLADANAVATQGIGLTQQAATNDDSELWSLTANGNGYILQNKATGLVIDDSGFSRSQGPTIILWKPNGGSNQRWAIQYR